MDLSSEGLALIKEFEGLRLHAYRCSAGVVTIGYGHTGSKWLHDESEITEVEAEELLKLDCKRFVQGVNDCLRVQVNQHEFDALVSFAFNCGISALRGSTLLRLLNDKCDKHIVAAEFQKWCKAGNKVLDGLLRRRKAEAALFLKTAPNSLLAHSIIAKQDTWLKRSPIQSSDLADEEKLFVPEGAAHVWKQIVMIPGEIHYKVILEAQPDKNWWIYPEHWKIINDPKQKNTEPQVQHDSKLILSTPYFSQRDNYRDASRTCFSSSCAMLVATLSPGSIENDDEYLETVFSIGDTTEAWVQIRALEQYGIKAEFCQDGGWSDIDSLLTDGVPVPIGILHHGKSSAPTGGGHWVIIVGRTEDNAGYIVNDPWGELDVKNGGYLNENGKHVIYDKKNLAPRWMVEGSGSGWFLKA